MILVRSPLRITLGGGGTDLPSYYLNYNGFVISAAIDKYVYVTVIKPFEEGIYLKYSEIERVDTIDKVAHPIIRETLKIIEIEQPQIEITTLADIPSGTGLGSSGSFTTALIKALLTYQQKTIDPRDLAELACKIEIDVLREPIGKQDQYISAVGGISCFEFNKNNSVNYKNLQIGIDVIHELEDNMLLFFTGYTRKASLILSDQNGKTENNDKDMIRNLHLIKDLGYKSYDAINAGNIQELGRIMDEHWRNKRKRSNGMSNLKIDEWYSYAKKNGAIGGKLVGAGGGGFLLFIANDRDKLKNAMQKIGLQQVRFKFDYEGTKIIMRN
jgi:D-glycero-alpha-D-manno-heptose-7-phosphate kinase